MTKLDERWAEGILTGVNALISEVRRLELVGANLEEMLGDAVGAMTEALAHVEAGGANTELTAASVALSDALLRIRAQEKTNG